MAESNGAENQNGLEDSLASEEWTIIDKKESKDDDESADAENSEKVGGAEKIAAPTEANEGSPRKESRIEECREATEKDLESDGISIISEESESEHVGVEESRIQRIEDWQLEESQALQLKTPSHSSGGNPISNILIACSVVILILGVMYATMGELKDIEGKLKELNDVKLALDRMRISMPDMQRLEAESHFKRYSSKYEISDEDDFDSTRVQNTMNANSINDRLEMLEMTHKNLCSTISKINSSNSVFGDICKTPKILTDMITFKKNLKRAHDETKGATSPDKRFFSLLEEKLDYVSESLLAEVSVIFLKFSGKISDRLSKFGHRLDRMYAQLCSSKNSGDMGDEFLNAFLNEDFQRKICKGTVVQDQYINESSKLNKTSKKKRSRNYSVGQKLNTEKYNYESRELRKPQGPENSSKEKFNNPEFDNFKSKGEMTFDEEWKKNKRERGENHHDPRKRHAKLSNDENEYQHWNERDHESRKESLQRAPVSDMKQKYNKPIQARDENLEYDRKNLHKTRNIVEENLNHDSNEKLLHVNNGHKDKHFEDFENKHDDDREFDRKKDSRNHDRDTHNEYRRKNAVKYESFGHKSKEKTDRLEREENSAIKKHENGFNVHYGPDNQDSHSRQHHPAQKSDRDSEKYKQKNSRSNARIGDHPDDLKENDVYHFENKFNNNKQNFDSKYERRNYKIYDDSKIANDWEDEGYESSDEEKSTYEKNMEYLPRPDNFKESKYTKHPGNDRKYKKDKRNTEGDWQMKRGEAREQMRNNERNNWFLDRADSRKWARSNEPQHQKNRIPPSPPPRQEPYRNERQNSWRRDDRPPLKKKSFKNRVIDKIGSTFRSLGLF